MEKMKRTHSHKTGKISDIKDLKKWIDKFKNESSDQYEKKIKEWKNALKLSKQFKDSNLIAVSYHEIAKLYMTQRNFIKVEKYLKSAIKQYLMLGDIKSATKLDIYIGACYIQTREFSKANCYLKTLKKNRKIDEFNLIILYKYMGLAYFYQSKYKEALEYYEKAVVIFSKLSGLSEQEQEVIDIAGLYNMIGMLHKSLGNYAKSLEYMLLSSGIKEKSGHKRSLAVNMNNIGAIYYEMNNFLKSLEYYSKALKKYKEINDNLGIAHALNNIGNVNKHLGNDDKAIELYLESLRFSKMAKDDFTIHSTLNNLGSLYSKKGDEKTALKYLNEALEYKRSVGNKEDVFITLIGICSLYTKLKQYDKALGIAQECMKIAEETDNNSLRYNADFQFAKIYESMQKYKKSLDHYVRFYELKDKIFTEESAKKIADMQARFDLEQKEKEAEFEREKAEAFKKKNTELEEKNELIEKQKAELEETIAKLHKSEIKYNFVSAELNRTIGTTLIGKSEAIKNIIELISVVAQSDRTNVLITGESGTGKEIVARNIHKFSKRKNRNFYAVNSSAIPDTLFESQFFGYEKNAFTGAISTKIGWFEIADKSTLFLDEIGSMSIEQQAKLLRVLEERKIVRVGSHQEIKIDVCIISATNINLTDKIKENSFRSDLYHRLATFVINIPPLRERKEDIHLLVKHFAKMFSQSLKKQIKRIEDQVYSKLLNYDFPGNVRELKNMVERAILISDSSTLKLEHFIIPKSEIDPDCFKDIIPLEVMEKNLVIKALKATGFHRVKAAELLKVNRKVIERRIKKYNLLTEK